VLGGGGGAGGAGAGAGDVVPCEGPSCENCAAARLRRSMWFEEVERKKKHKDKKLNSITNSGNGLPEVKIRKGEGREGRRKVRE
jgi:hypothetical protein